MTKADAQERDLRLKRTRNAMVTHELDALLVAGKGHWWTGRGYLRYFTDFHLWGHDGLYLLPLAGEPALTLSSAAVAKRIAEKGWVTDTCGDVFLIDRMVDAIKKRGLSHSRIGIAGYRFILSAGSYEELKKQLPDVTFVNADTLIDKIRMIKSPLEIKQEYELWAIAKKAMTYYQSLLPDAKGVSQRELTAEVCKQIWASGARDILIFIGEHPGTYEPPRDVPLQCNDKLRFHLEICGESGHWCELTINCAFKPPHELELKLMQDELLAFDELRRLAKPGKTLADLAARFHEVLRSQGWQVEGNPAHFYFHGQGMDTIERPWFSMREPSQDWALESGMVFSYHPHINVLPEGLWSTGLNEDILITDQGAERLSTDWNQNWRML